MLATSPESRLQRIMFSCGPKVAKRAPQFVVLCSRTKLRFITCAQEGLKRNLRKGVTDLAFFILYNWVRGALAFHLFDPEGHRFVLCINRSFLITVCQKEHTPQH